MVLIVHLDVVSCLIGEKQEEEKAKRSGVFCVPFLLESQVIIPCILVVMIGFEGFSLLFS